VKLLPEEDILPKEAAFGVFGLGVFKLLLSGRF
jgi:hypothetical protein